MKGPVTLSFREGQDDRPPSVMPRLGEGGTFKVGPVQFGPAQVSTGKVRAPCDGPPQVSIP